MFQHLKHRGARRGRGRPRNWKLIWKNNGELPQYGKRNTLSGSPGSSESPKEVGLKDSRKNTPRHIIITLGKIKDKERILKTTRRDSYLQRSSHKTMSWFLKRNLAGKTGLERSIQSHERQGPTSKITLSTKLSFRMERQIKCFSDKIKLKKFIITKPLLYEMLKGFI